MHTQGIMARPVAALSLFACFFFVTPAAAEDLIFRKDGKVTRVYQVTAATWTEVRFIVKAGLQEQRLPRTEVRRLRFGDTPPAYTAGEEYLRKGEYEKAIRAFKEAQTDPKVRSWWASVWCRRGQARAYLAWARREGDAAKAGEAARLAAAVLKEHPENFFKPEFQLIRIEALILAGNAEEASRLAEAFEKESASWPEKDWYVQAKLLGARALEGSRKYDEAAAKLDTLVTFARTQGLKKWEIRGQVLKAESLLAAGKKDRARREFERLVAAIDTTWSRTDAAAALVGLGRVLLEHFNAPDEARERLLRARVLYYTTAREAQDIMAACCYWLGRANEATAAKGERGARVAAAKYYQEILNRYPTSRWVARAREALARVK